MSATHRPGTLSALPEGAAGGGARSSPSGRITISESLVLYLFGVPGQERFWFTGDEPVYGALGAVVLADVRRLDDCFPSVNYFETRELPFIVAVNCVDDAPRYDLAEVRLALDLDDVPLVRCDARHQSSVRETLIRLAESIAAGGTSAAQGRSLSSGR